MIEMRTDKYYGTLIFYTPNEKFLEKYGRTNHHQYRVVCKAKSMAEANRIAESLGLHNKTFTRNYTEETGNDKEIEMCNKYGFIISTTGTSMREYVDIREALKRP
jgi:ribosomal protein S16